MPIPQFTQANLKTHEEGVAWLLADTQIQHRAGGYSTYNRLTQKVIDRIGLESASKLNITINPETEKLSLVSLIVVRDGIPVDRSNAVRIDSFRSESEEAPDIFTGKKTYSILLSDVKVGDIVDVAYLREASNGTIALPFDYSLSLDFTVPIERIYRSIIWPKSQPLDIREYETSIKPVVTTSGDNSFYVWDLSKPAVHPRAPNLPPELFGQGWAAISEAKSWHEIVDPLLPYYRTDLPLPLSLSSRLDAIAAKYIKPTERLTEAMRLVQDEIRYVSLSIGNGAILPRSPSEVMATGYGDCKDKSLLLASTLRYLGIEAVVALTDLDNGNAIADLPPSLLAFDHAIVRARLNGNDIWLDATNFSQGGRGFGIEQPRYGYALPLITGNGELAKMSTFYPHSPTQVTEEEYTLPTAEVGPMSIKVITTFTGPDADWYRKKIANETEADLAKRYMEYYAGKFPGLTSTAALKVTDNRDYNSFVLEENYQVPDFDRRNGEIIKNFPVKGNLSFESLPELTPPDRALPGYVGTPYNAKHITRIRNLDSKFSHPDAPENLGRWFTLYASSTNSDDAFELTWDFKSLGGEVLPSEIAGYMSARTSMRDATDRLYDFTNSTETATNFGFFSLSPVAMSILFLVVLIASILVNLRQLPPRYDGNAFQPVGLLKFAVMSLLTGSVYNIYWAWMGFRQNKINKGIFGIPLLQAMLTGLLAFNIMNIVSDGKLSSHSKKIRYLVLAGATLYFASSVYDALNVFFPEKFALGWFDDYKLLYIIYALVPLPLVWLANKSNEQAVLADDSYRRFTRLDLLSIAVFGGLFVAIAFRD